MAPRVRLRHGEQCLGVHALAGHGTVAALHEPGAVAVIVERGRVVVEVDPHPHFGVDRPPEEHRLLDVAVTRTTERGGDGGSVPVLAAR